MLPSLAKPLKSEQAEEKSECGLRPRKMEIHLPNVPVMEIFSYLDAFSLLQAAQVNKSWNLAATSDSLWRKLCKKRWLCYDLSLDTLGAQTWKEYFLRKTRQEHSMSRAKPEDFIYKEMSGDFGVEGTAYYLSGSGLTHNGQGKSIVCVVTSMTRLTTWDIREDLGDVGFALSCVYCHSVSIPESICVIYNLVFMYIKPCLHLYNKASLVMGAMTWVSPIQPTCIMRLATLPELRLAITVDMEATIKVWNCYDKDALATNSMFASCQILKAVLTKDGPIVLAGDDSGNLHTFRIPDLHLISRVHAIEFAINQLHCSPQRKWVYLNKKHPHVWPKVYLMKSLLRPSEYPTPVCTTINYTLSFKAFWTPRREDRITLLSQRGPRQVSKFVTFDIELERTEDGIDAKARPVASFTLPSDVKAPEWMGVSDKDVIVCSSGTSLLVYNMKGFQLQRLQDYPAEIMRLLVDPLHVIVTYMDGSLEVYMWEESSPYLKKCYHLQNPRHMGRQSMLPKTLCDNVSIIRVVTKGPNCCFLMAYVLKVCS
ncbi:F-box/WD repeat-containing protein 12 isoform X2 [Peromyscus maniculatus bairdii]|uniref:F-box/WD repeat-containing protein 12 isoform X2 n=1 Tax=Peromyscus maniculatus bairdii TaxID=230844 RepID=UPI003FCF9ECC